MHFPPAAHFDIFLQMAWQKGAWGRWSGTKDRPVWSLSSTSQKHWPACPSHPAGGLVGRRRAWYCRCCCEGQRRGRQEVSSAWPLRLNIFLCSLKFVHTSRSWTSVFYVFFPFGVISQSSSTGDLFLKHLLGTGCLTSAVLRFCFQVTWKQDLGRTGGWRGDDLFKNQVSAQMRKYSFSSSTHLWEPDDWHTGCLWEQVGLLYELFGISGFWGVKVCSGNWAWTLV